MMRNEEFNIDELQIEVEPHMVEVDQKVSKRRPPRKGEFVMVPIEWVYRLAGARCTATVTLALHLLHRAFKERNQTIKVANGMVALKGINRCQKRRALAELEAMGLVEVEHRERKSPNVTLLYPEPEGESGA
jgi:hypothetical protein